MARPKVKTALIQIKLKNELKEKVKAIAEKRGKALTDLITEFLEMECKEPITLKTKKTTKLPPSAELLARIAAARIDPLIPIPKPTFGKWSVNNEGDMSFDDDRYNIYSNQLKDNNWILHLSEKGWIDFNDFIPAYFQALKNIGCKNIKMITYY